MCYHFPLAAPVPFGLSYRLQVWFTEICQDYTDDYCSFISSVTCYHCFSFLTFRARLSICSQWELDFYLLLSFKLVARKILTMSCWCSWIASFCSVSPFGEKILLSHFHAVLALVNYSASIYDMHYMRWSFSTVWHARAFLISDDFIMHNRSARHFTRRYKNWFLIFRTGRLGAITEPRIEREGQCRQH